MGYFCDPVTGGPVQLDLRSINGQEFRLLAPFAYRHDDHREQFVVPADLETFRTDLATVPGLLTWLVPRSGVFLPAAILHDALVWPGENHLGPRVTRRRADRIFRDALVELGTGTVRAWLMWSAVAVVTMWIGDGPRDPARTARRVVLVVSLALVALLAVLLVLGLTGVAAVLPGVGPLTTDAPAASIAALAAALAWCVAVPAALAPAWGSSAAAPLIAGTALLVTWPALVPLVALTAGYRVLERLVSGPVVDGRRRRPGDAKARAQAFRARPTR